MADYRIDCPHENEYLNFWKSTEAVYDPKIGATRLRSGNGYTKRCKLCGFCARVTHYPTDEPSEFETVETECPQSLQRPDATASSSDTAPPSSSKTETAESLPPDPSSPGPSE